MPSAADHLTRLAASAEAIGTLARRADRNAIDRLTVTGRLDGHTLTFLRRAQDLVLTTVQALTTLIETHNCFRDPASEHGCRQCGNSNTSSCPAIGRLADLLTAADSGHLAAIDAAEAWRRAHLHLPNDHEESLLVHIHEFQDGYQAIPILVSIPEPSPVPTIETGTTLVIDKTTGTVTRWPLLPIPVLAQQYRRYLRREPMTFDDHLQ